MSSCRTAIGLRVKDGIVLAVEKIIHSKLLVPDANRRIQSVDRHIGLVGFKHSPGSVLFISLQATAGFLADGRHLANRARDESSNYRETYRQPAPLKVGSYSMVVIYSHACILRNSSADYQCMSRHTRYTLQYDRLVLAPLSEV